MASDNRASDQRVSKMAVHPSSRIENGKTKRERAGKIRVFQGIHYSEDGGGGDEGGGRGGGGSLGGGGGGGG